MKESFRVSLLSFGRENFSRPGDPRGGGEGLGERTKNKYQPPGLICTCNCARTENQQPTLILVWTVPSSLRT